MKKILFVITKSNWGGAQRYVYDLAASLPKDEYDVSVALGRSPATGEAFGMKGQLAEKLQEVGIKTYEIAAMQRDIAIFKECKVLSELVKLFKREKPDVVHLNSSKAGGIGALAARLAGVPKIVFTVHGLPEDEVRSPLAKLLIKLATRVTVWLCHHVIAVSEDNHARVPGSVLIYNGIGRMDFGSGDVIRSVFPTGVKITGTVGELTHNKNQISLLEQARANKDMYVAIVGEGELHNQLEQYINKYNLQDRVKLFGFKPASEVLKGFDVFALPSKKEGLPYALLEAKLAGLPIVATPVGGIPEILSKDVSEFSLEKMVHETAEVYKKN